MSRWDVAVAGAGIVGAACARALAREGFRVVVVEPRFIGAGATAAGMGHLVVMDDSEAQFALTRYSQQQWDLLAARFPREVEFERSGTIWVAEDDEQMQAVRRKHSAYIARGVPGDVLDPKDLARLEPRLRSGLAGGLLVPGDSVLYPPAAARFLLRLAERDGAEVRLGKRIVAIDDDGVRLDDESRLSCRWMVDASGAAGGVVGSALPVRPRKGHLLITDRYPGFLRHQLVELGYLKSAHGHAQQSVAFNVQPRSTGQLLIGSSRQYDITALDVDMDITARMLQRAVQFLPDLAGLSAIRVWTGIRAATADGLPLIGPWPDRPNYYVATGHEGLGITTSLGTAEILVALLLQRDPPLPAAPYLPARLVAA
jgi:D-hydroxyproline dehydrogenase subunit beta